MSRLDKRRFPPPLMFLNEISPNLHKTEKSKSQSNFRDNDWETLAKDVKLPPRISFSFLHANDGFKVSLVRRRQSMVSSPCNRSSSSEKRRFSPVENKSLRRHSLNLPCSPIRKQLFRSKSPKTQVGRNASQSARSTHQAPFNKDATKISFWNVKEMREDEEKCIHELGKQTYTFRNCDTESPIIDHKRKSLTQYEPFAIDLNRRFSDSNLKKLELAKSHNKQRIKNSLLQTHDPQLKKISRPVSTQKRLNARKENSNEFYQVSMHDSISEVSMNPRLSMSSRNWSMSPLNLLRSTSPENSMHTSNLVHNKSVEYHRDSEFLNESIVTSTHSSSMITIHKLSSNNSSTNTSQEHSPFHLPVSRKTQLRPFSAHPPSRRFSAGVLPSNSSSTSNTSHSSYRLASQNNSLLLEEQVKPNFSLFLPPSRRWKI